MKSTWSVVVIHEDPASRELAVSFCDRLVERFWNKLEFDIGWWSYQMLGQAQAARLAADRAEMADLIVFATATGGEPPFDVRAWLDQSLRKRKEREGAIAGLTPNSANPCATACLADIYLRNMAHRAGLDYLTQIPQNIRDPIPDSFAGKDDRVSQVTSVLHNILSQHPLPARPL
jgi:hypothetical protein